MKLYEITEAIRQVELRIDAEIEAGDGEVPADLAAMLDELELAQTEKVDGLAAIIVERSREAAALAEESRRLRDRAATQERVADRLKAYLLASLAARQLDSVKTPRFSVSRCRNSRPSIRWAGGESIPPEFARVKVELDGDKALEAYKSGSLPDGFEASVGEHLRVR